MKVGMEVGTEVGMKTVVCACLIVFSDSNNRVLVDGRQRGM